MSSWHYIVLGCCPALLGILLWQEWRRPTRSWLLWRCIATVAAVAGLACLGLPIGYWRNKAVGRVGPAAGELPPAGLHGVVAVDWQRRLARGEGLQVQGRWAGGSGKLLLMGMGGVMDSTTVRGPGNFSLGGVPAHIGRAVYRLVVVEGKDTLAREDVPVEVVAGAPLRVLLLAGSPDFENSFLMKWLSADGHLVASRTAVSRGKVQETFVNREGVGLAALTPGLLGEFDVVIADAGALPVRGTAEGNVLWRQVEEKGLGLVMKVDSASLDSMVKVMRRRPGRVMAKDSLGRVAVGSVLDGAGKVVFTALNTSYSRWLAGDRVGYAEYWTKLLKGAARRGEAQEEWSVEPALPKVWDEVSLELQTAVDTPRGVAGSPEKGNVTVYLAQDAGLPFEWRGSYWPKEEGWQWVCRPTGDTTWWYAWPRDAWRGIGGARNIGERKERPGREWVEYPKGWFWGLFLLGAAFLWVERKMGGMNG